MLKKVLVIAMAVMFVASVSAFACGGDKTAKVEKASAEKYACDSKAEKAGVKTASAEKADSKAYTCSKSKEASMKTAAATSEDAKASDKACTESASVKTAAASSGDCPYMKANAEKSADCASKCSGVKKASDKKDAEKIDVDKTAMVDKKDNENL